jgi:hypothetical protein
MSPDRTVCPGCQGAKPPSVVVCSRCWSRLPFNTQRALSRIEWLQDTATWLKNAARVKQLLAQGKKPEELHL